MLFGRFKDCVYMDKIIERGLLFDFYGELLTKHQQKIYSDAVFNDLSLSELSEETGISRQGIHDLIRRCDKQLEQYESKLHLIERFKTIKKKTSSIDTIVYSSYDIDSELIAEIRKNLDGIIEVL